MAENTKIQWTARMNSHGVWQPGLTFNPWIGCSKVSEGCKFCYAENLMDHRYHRVRWGSQGTRSRTKTWSEPLRCNREAERLGERRKVFCASLADVFEDRDELIPWREDLFKLIDRCSSLDWLLLTKRPENIASMWPEGYQRLRENVWLGTSIANQGNAETALDELVACREFSDTLFVSLEPQIDFVDLHRWLSPSPLVDWVIVGGESKQGKEEPRRFDIRWAVDMLYDCQQAGVPCFIKQFGSNAFDGTRKLDLQDSHGGDMTEWPEILRVRECPESYVRS